MTLAEPLDTEDAIFAAVRQGDAQAMAVLMHRHEALVRSAIYAAAGRRLDTDDVLQQVWMKVWRQASTLQETSQWKPWLYQVARHAALDSLKLQRRRLSFLRRLSQWIRPLQSAAPPEASLQQQEQRQRVLEAIESLPDLYREVFVLRHLQDLSYREIADLCSLNVEAVETRLVRARRLLREKLQSELASAKVQHEPA